MQLLTCRFEEYSCFCHRLEEDVDAGGGVHENEPAPRHEGVVVNASLTDEVRYARNWCDLGYLAILYCSEERAESSKPSC